MIRCAFCLVAFAVSAVNAESAALKVLPAEVTLTGPQATQRLLVLVEDAGKVTGDRTAAAVFASSNEKVVKVSGRGEIQAIGDGEAVVTARQDGKTATAKVTVKGAKGETVWSFRNDVIPLLTKTGCNSGTATERLPARAVSSCRCAATIPIPTTSS